MTDDTQKDSKTNIYRVQVLERALDVLDSFDFQNRELGLSQIAKKTGLNMTTAKRLISNLTDRGYLDQDLATKRYRLGMRLFELGGVVFSSFSLRRVAAAHMSALQKKTDATILLGAPIEDQLVYIDKRKGRGMIHISSDIGWRRPLHYGMLGMVLLAFCKPAKIKKILRQQPLEAHTPRSITDLGAFSMRLEEIRKNGYCLEYEEAAAGIVGVAAPIRDYTRHVVAALGAALPVSQGTEKEIQHITKMLQLSVEKISDSLGYLKV